MKYLLSTVLVLCLSVLLLKTVIPWYDFDVREIPGTNHPWFRLSNLWNVDQMETLQSLVKRHVFRQVTEDRTFEQLLVKYPQVNGTCTNPYLLPQGDICVLPGRIDIFQHYAKTGGRYGAKEKYDQLSSNVQSFAHYLFDEDLEMEEFQSLFNSPNYLTAASEICGSGHPFLKRTQVNLIVMLPGQDLPVHYDLPWFWGASRHTLPQWVLLSMAASGAWKQQLLPQVQGVAYLHLKTDPEGGEFFLYPGDGSSVEVPATPNTGLVLDGVKVMHGVQRFQFSKSAPVVGKDKMELFHKGDDIWIVRKGNSDDESDVVATYKTQDLRISLVWRSICFPTAQHRDQWDPRFVAENMTTEKVILKLEEIMHSEGSGINKEDQVSWALGFVEHFIKYPTAGKAWIPWNYCMLPSLISKEGWMAVILQHITNIIC